MGAGLSGGLPSPRYDHLLHLIDATGIFEHALHGIPRREHGYTTDDATRALVVLCRARSEPQVTGAIATLLGFVLHAIHPNGRVHNRLGYDRRWQDEPSHGDHHGRTAWALGVASEAAPRPEWQQAAHAAFSDLEPPEGPHLRPYALAALGAGEVWRSSPGHPVAAAIIDRATDRLTSAGSPWPERRLTYANGRIPQALLALGSSLARTDLVERGLEALTWLHGVESRGGSYSFTPVGGWAPGEPRPGFDQQPIEAAALADAAFEAWRITGDADWAEAVRQAGRWLCGDNDARTPLVVPETGACCDGLEPDGVNANQGAESTISGVSVLQACEAVSGARADGGQPAGSRLEPGR